MINSLEKLNLIVKAALLPQFLERNNGWKEREGSWRERQYQNKSGRNRGKQKVKNSTGKENTGHGRGQRDVKGCKGKNSERESKWAGD